MRFNRRRSVRPDSARSRLGSSLEGLETRELLTNSTSNIFSVYHPTDIGVYNPITNQPSKYSVVHQLDSNPSVNNSLFTNSGKILSGKDRAGDEWTITVHGPGYAIVTTSSPNSGTLSDNINTIQLVGTDINKTYVTGNVVASDRVQTSGTIPFNQLIAQSGVRSIILNGFDLQETVTPAAGLPANSGTKIELLGGVRYLQFHDINAPVDSASTTSVGADAINVIIGDPSIPLKIKPTIVINSINNTVYDSSVLDSATPTAPTSFTPQTTPTVNIIVNGQIANLSLTSTSADLGSVLLSQGFDSSSTAAEMFLAPTVNVTGRTSVQAIGLNNLYVYGGATNLTASRASTPFQNGFTGLDHLTTATFNGPTDAVGLDVKGPVGKLTFNKGVGNTTNVFTGTVTQPDLSAAAAGSTATVTSQVPASSYGQPADQTSYAGAGLLSAQVTATKIGSVKIKNTEVNTQTPLNPDFVQVRGIGVISSAVRPGTAAVNTLITSSGSIGKVKVTGDLVNTEIKSGFDYQSAASGLEGTRAPSTIAPVQINGNLINGVISATYRPFMNFYGSTSDVAGPGKVVGTVTGTAVNTGAATPLGNTGAGVYARVKVGKLPEVKGA